MSPWVQRVRRWHSGGISACAGGIGMFLCGVALDERRSAYIGMLGLFVICAALCLVFFDAFVREYERIVWRRRVAEWLEEEKSVARSRDRHGRVGVIRPPPPSR